MINSKQQLYDALRREEQARAERALQLAAPELLRACKEALDAIKGTEYRDLKALLRNAIAKAEGRS